MENIKWPSIGQFRHTVNEVQLHHDYKGKDEEDKPIYKHTTSYPIITFEGTVKLHGTNAGITLDFIEENLYIQTRNEVLPLYDGGHEGFVQWVRKNETNLHLQFDYIMGELGPDAFKEVTSITLFGEWAGNGIQSGVGVSQIEKSFFVFSIITVGPNGKVYYPATSIKSIPEINYYNILDFPQYSIEVDFNNPDIAAEELTKLTEAVEAECPVAKALGVDNGVGEGIVWIGKQNEHIIRFKTKGKKHSVAKEKTIVTISPEKLADIEAFANYSVTSMRIKQAMQETGAETKGDTGKLVHWITNDVAKEEVDVLDANNLDWKEVIGQVSKKAVLIFHNYLENKNVNTYENN